MELKKVNNYVQKKNATKKVVTPDPIFKSTIIPKLINSIMYDGKKVVAEKIVYEAIEKIKSKTKEEPINVFNEAINNIKPTVEVRSRRVGGATYQVPVEVKNNRAQALAIRWLVDASRKRKDKHMSDKIFNELYDAYEKKGSAVKKREDVHKMAESNKAFAHFRW
jgi:small subunit ribosomal protein S7